MSSPSFASRAQVSVPPVQLPQFAGDDFVKANLGIFNATISSIARRINALTPRSPGVSLKTQFIPQFMEEDFQKEGLSFVNQQLQTIAQNVNQLTVSDSNVKPIAITQLTMEDFKEPAIPNVAKYLTEIINRLNTAASL